MQRGAADLTGREKCGFESGVGSQDFPGRQAGQQFGGRGRNAQRVRVVGSDRPAVVESEYVIADVSRAEAVAFEQVGEPFLARSGEGEVRPRRAHPSRSDEQNEPEGEPAAVASKPWDGEGNPPGPPCQGGQPAAAALEPRDGGVPRGRSSRLAPVPDGPRQARHD